MTTDTLFDVPPTPPTEEPATATEQPEPTCADCGRTEGVLNRLRMPRRLMLCHWCWKKRNTRAL